MAEECKHMRGGQDRISVIVPVYNVGRYLKRCLDSIQQQTYKELEVILIDDGSSDDSGAICDEYVDTDSRFHVIHQANGGAAAARNRGLENCHGQYIMFVDGDDYIAPTMCETLLHYLKTAEADISICGIYFIDVKEHARVSSFHGARTCRTISGWTAMKEYFVKNQIATVVWNKLYISELFQGVNGIRFPEGERFEDHFVTYRLLYQAKRVAVINEPLCFHVNREGSTTHELKTDDILGHRSYIRDYYQWANGQPADIQEAVEYRCLCIFNDLVKNYVKRPDFKYVRPWLKQLNDEILQQTRFPFKNRTLFRKSFRIYLLMKLHLLIMEKELW